MSESYYFGMIMGVSTGMALKDSTTKGGVLGAIPVIALGLYMYDWYQHHFNGYCCRCGHQHEKKNVQTSSSDK